MVRIVAVDCEGADGVTRLAAEVLRKVYRIIDRDDWDRLQYSSARDLDLSGSDDIIRCVISSRIGIMFRAVKDVIYDYGRN
jgi:hypothetical protein